MSEDASLLLPDTEHRVVILYTLCERASSSMAEQVTLNH
jgi:hypothetical protein